MITAPDGLFLEDFIGSAALSLAFKSGLIDKLSEGRQQVSSLAAAAKLDRDGVSLLARLLESAGVVTFQDGALELTAAFSGALHRRPALESKLAFLELAARDVFDCLPEMLFDREAYVASGRVFKLFSYDRAGSTSVEDIEFTRRWLNYTTALTEQEAPLLVPLMSLRGTRRLLDVGGNSGAFARALCAANSDLSVTVLDLPAVVELGRRRMATDPVAGRIDFLSGDARRNSLPSGYEAICFKSVLHDWPEDDARLLLRRAFAELPTGGRIFIVERGEFAPGAGQLGYAALANLVFARFYRSPSVYVGMLRDMGFTELHLQTVEIEMPFHVIEGTRP